MGKNAKKRRERRRRTVEKPSDINAWLESLPDVNTTPAVDDATYPDAEALLTEVIDQYLNSREFNGLPVGESAGPHANAEKLVRDGLIQVVTSTDYLNTHIRPWVKDDVDRQAAELVRVAAGALTGCLYPTPKAMKAYAPALTHTHPYRDRMTTGGGTLELAFFDLAAVEGYVNDPDFTFEFGDDGRRADRSRRCNPEDPFCTRAAGPLRRKDVGRRAGSRAAWGIRAEVARGREKGAGHRVGSVVL